MPQIHDRLNGTDEFWLLQPWLVAHYVHVETRALLRHGLPDAASANDVDGLASYLVAEKRQIRLPEPPLVFANQFFRSPQPPCQGSQSKKSKFGRGLGEHIRRVGVGNFEAIGGSAVDVVEADCELRHGFQRA